MRADIIRIYKTVHTWTGILTGMALFIAFYAGALTVFKEPLARWASPPPTPQLQTLDVTPTLIAKVLATRPELARGFSVYLLDTEEVRARLGWQVRDPDADDHDTSTTRHYIAWLNPQGEAQTAPSGANALTTFIDVLHRVVGLPVDNDPNRWIMGVVAALYSVALVSGLIVLLPSLIKDFFALRIGKNLKRMWLDAHNVVGLVSLPFHVIMALTSVVFAYHDGIYALQDKLIHGGKLALAFQQPGGQASDHATQRDPATLLSPLELVAKAQTLSPSFTPVELQYQQVTGSRAVVRVWGKDARQVAPRGVGGFIALDPYTGKILNTDYLPGKQTTALAWIGSFFALHMAAFGGAAGQWLYFLLGLAGAWLFYSGNLLWIETRRKRTDRKTGAVPLQRLDTRLMASATVGVCLGCVCGISLMMVASKWLNGRVADLYAWLQVLYYLTFFACLGWAFVRGGARAGVTLLRWASALTLAIPGTSLIGAVFPATGLWGHTSPASLAVDLTALLGAASLVWMAHAAARRMRPGAADSVWATAEKHLAQQRRAGQFTACHGLRQGVDSR